MEYLNPISPEIIQFIEEISPQSLGKSILLHTKNNFPDLSKIKFALIGVKENRADKNAKTKVELEYIRKAFYTLFAGNWIESIADLGDVLQGDQITDSYFAVQSICDKLIRKKIIPIIIGGSNDLTYAMYRGYDNLDQMVNLVSVNTKFNFGKDEETLSSQSYLTRIVVDEPNNLFNFSNIGYQSYLNSQEELDLIDKLYFDAYRLGEISKNIVLTEPVFRDADLVSIDLNSIQSSFSGNFENFMPNGLDGKEICTLSRYAGLSDKVSSLGIFNHNNSEKESGLIAQIIWYFIEGYHLRSNEYPFGSKEHYIKYIVLIEKEEIIFYKSNKTDRWWIEIEYRNINKTKKSTLLPCNHADYLAACNQEIPERWWKAQQKNIN